MPRVDQDSFYRNALARYGENAEGAHWHSTAAQHARFEALLGLLPTDLGAATLVDVGCGLGCLHGFLAAQGRLPRRYTGIDVVEPMVQIARERTRCQILHRDALCDPLPTADYYVACGSLNLLTRDETSLILTRCLAAARTGLLFNLLKGRNQSGSFNFWQPDEITALGSALGARVTLVEGYFPGDFTAAFEHPNV